jgi:tRNA(adenine34) deaminase
MNRHSSADKHFMHLALQQARLALATPGAGEVGCVIVKDGKVVAEAFNEGDLHFDPTAHAEMVAIRKLAAKWRNVDLRGASLYCTLQPCAMCTMACIWANIGRIIYGAGRNDVNSIYFELRHFNTADLIRDAFKDDLEVLGGVLSEECSTLYVKRNEPVPPEKSTRDIAH